MSDARVLRLVLRLVRGRGGRRQAALRLVRHGLALHHGLVRHGLLRHPTLGIAVTPAPGVAVAVDRRSVLVLGSPTGGGHGDHDGGGPADPGPAAA